MQVRRSGGVRSSLGGPRQQAVPPPPFYDVLPDGEVSVDEFAEFARERLNALREMDKVCGYDSSLDTAHKALDENVAKVEQALTKCNLLQPERSDAIGHNILRLAFCKTEESRKWFLRQEERLFSFRMQRFQKMTSGDKVRRFLREHGVLRSDAANVVSPDHEDRTFYNDLVNVTVGAEQGTTFYGLPFGTVPSSLLAMRKVVLRKGVAYIPEQQLRLLVTRKFREHLERQMEVAVHCAAAVERDPRLGPLLNEMSNITWSGPQSATAIADDEKLTLSSWQAATQQSFPPCMRNLVEQMHTRKKHLKYKGRTQLQPFLRSAGFTLEESLVWWREAMTKDQGFDGSKFDKEYAYGIKYTYGKVGNMKEKSCMNCTSLGGLPFPAGEEAHGCPFRHSELKSLEDMLRGWGLAGPALAEVLKKAKEGHPHLACRDYFKARHPGNDGEEMGSHPMQYYQESMRYHLEKERKAKATLKKEAVVKQEPAEPAEPAAPPAAPALVAVA